MFELACVLEAGEGRGALERLAQHVDAFGAVSARSPDAEQIVGQAARNAHEKGMSLIGC